MSPEDRRRVETSVLLKDVPVETGRKVADAATIQVFAPDATIFRTGEKAAFLHLILAGRIALIGEGAGDAAVIEAFGEGEALLTPAVVLDLPYLLTARALIETRVAAIPADAFRVLLDREAALARGVVDQLARHWRVLIRQIKDLKLRAGAQRLASYLLTQDRSRSGRLYLPMERRLLAGRLGMSPEHLSRAFAQLRQHGVATMGRAVTLADDAALRRFCDFDPVM
jgi:CRP/FNR family transcriptional activator FtrB